MKITVKVKSIEITVDENVNNTQIKYGDKVIETIKAITEECIKLLKQSEL